jgi:UDP-N-acetylmuramate dehydrogenase
MSADAHYSITPLIQYSSETSMVEVELKSAIQAISGLTLKTGEPLARFTTMKIGGPADYFVEVGDEAALRRLLPLLREHRIAVSLLGNGSNVLVSDRGVRGAVIHLAGNFKKVAWFYPELAQGRGEQASVVADAGAACVVTRLAREAARKGYAGLEFAEGIPGTIGGALVMNAGAYGSEFEKIVEQVECVTPQGAGISMSRSEMNFSYRDSHLPPGVVVTRVRLRLMKDEAARVSSKLRALVARRKSSQPAGRPNSGSMFRNPPGDFAGRLIEAAGLKGKRIGQAQISEVHANFIVNLGAARAAEVRQLMELARAEVEQRFGVVLTPEVKYLGDWTEA